MPVSRSVLLLLSQFPHDNAGGAVRSLRTICEMLAASGMRVACLGTTASDHAAGIDARQALSALGCRVYEDRSAASVGETSASAPTLVFTHRLIEYALLDTGAMRSTQWDQVHGPRFDRLLDALLKRLRPDVVLTMGALRPERERQRRCRERGAAVVLGVRQHGYYDLRAFEHVNDALMPSEFLRACYRAKIGYVGTAIPSPIEPDDVVALEKKPTFVTLVNPSREKGVMLFARLAHELSLRRPDIPILVIESRGTSGTLLAAAARGGLDLKQHANIMVSPGVPLPKSFYAATRIMLAPSVWDEPSGRVAQEAMLNGIPPIVSDRGGLPETVSDGGFVIPMPASLTVETDHPVGPEVAMPWVALIERLTDDRAFYAEASDRALAQGQRYLPAALADRYVEYVQNLSRRARP